jgi:hypothetical protein
MFNLEQAVAEWRRQMVKAGIKTPVPLEELEIHLREDIAQQMRSGLSAQQAFGIAVKKIGHAPELKREFKKVSAPMEAQFVKLAGIACVVVALFCPLCVLIPVLFNPAISWWPKALGLAAVATTIATTILSWRYNHKFLPVICSQLVRRSVGIVCYVGCVVWIRLFLMNFPQETPRSLLLVAFLYGSGWTVMAMLGGVGHGLEKAVSMQDQTAAA